MDETRPIASISVKQEPIDGGTGQNPVREHDRAVEDVDEVATPVVRRRGRPKGWRKANNMREKTPKDTTVKTRCSVSTAMEFFHQEVFPLLSDEHIKILSETPFLHLFAFPRGTSISRPIIHQILLLWDKSEDCFKFKGKVLEFRPEEVSLMMGLQFNGSTVIYERQELRQSVIRSRYFQPSGEIGRNLLEERILDCLRDDSPASDVVSLLVMYLFTTILFPQANGSVPVHMFPYVDDLDRLNAYSWGKAVYWLLRDNIPKCAAWCREMERVGGLDVEDTIYGQIIPHEGEVRSVKSGKGKKRKMEANKACLSGCTIALMAWFFEHISFKKVEIMTGGVPRFRNWRFRGNFSRERFAQELDNVPIGIIMYEALKPTSTEEVIIETGFQASMYVSFVKEESRLEKFYLRPLALLLKQMVPVYWKFNFPVSHFLMSQVSKDRLDELDYSAKGEADESLSDGDDEIAPSLEGVPCEDVPRVESNSCTVTGERLSKKSKTK